MATKGLPKKYAKLGFAKGWKAYKASKRKVKKKAKKTVKKVAKKKVAKKPATKKRKVSRTRKVIKTIKKGVKKMAKRRRKKAVAKSRRRRRVNVLGNRTMNALVNGGIIGGTAVGSTWLVNMIPMVREQASWIKALVQAGIGVGGMTFSKQLMVKKAFSGFIAGAAISLVLPYMPEGFRFGGNGRAFNPAELMELQTAGNNKAGRPVSLGRSVSFSGRGTRNYSKGAF